MMPTLYRTELKTVQFDQLHDIACAHGEEQFARYGECPPMWILNLGNKLVWIESKYSDDREKYGTTRLIAKMLQMLECKSYSMIVEAWVAVETAGPDGKMPDNPVLPSDRPKNERDDVLLVTSESRGGENRYTRYLVTERKPRLNFLGPRVDERDLILRSGNMMGLFKKAVEL